MTNTSKNGPTIEDVRNWWGTSVSKTEPGVIEYRGLPIQELIGSTSFVEGMWLLVMGTPLAKGRQVLLEAALLAASDHGPQAPSIASARMAITCGVGLNSAVANGVNTLGDVHGGAGQQCVDLLHRILQESQSDGANIESATAQIVAEYKAEKKFIPGFGHRFHPRDPRRDPLIGLIEDAVKESVIDGDYLACALALEAELSKGREKPIPMNIDGATAIIYAELGCEPELARGFFVLSRSVGILAHAWEEKSSNRRIKGPLPPPLTAPYIQPE